MLEGFTKRKRLEDTSLERMQSDLFNIHNARNSIIYSLYDEQLNIADRERCGAKSFMTERYDSRKQTADRTRRIWHIYRAARLEKISLLHCEIRQSKRVFRWGYQQLGFFHFLVYVNIHSFGLNYCLVLQSLQVTVWTRQSLRCLRSRSPCLSCIWIDHCLTLSKYSISTDCRLYEVPKVIMCH